MICHRFWRRIWRSEDASTTTEFAFVAPVVLLVIAGIIDFMLALFVTSLLEGGLQNASRLARTGFQSVVGPRIDAIRNEIEDATIGFVDMDDIVITSKVYPCFDSINQPEPYMDNSPANGSYDVGEVYTDVNGNGTRDLDMATSGFGAGGSGTPRPQGPEAPATRHCPCAPPWPA